MNRAGDIAFSDTVKAIQTRKGSRDLYDTDSWTGQLNADIAAFIAEQTSVYLGTVSADGQPYIQHRGGPQGFLHVIDDYTIAFADFRGNRQYISQGNLQDNPKAFLFLMDYSTPQRLKLWGEAKVIEGDEALCAKLMPPGYRAKADQVVEFTVKLWNFNCRAHIPQRFNAVDVAAVVAQRDARIAELEQTIAQLQSANPQD